MLFFIQQFFNVLDETVHIRWVGAIAEGADMAVFVHQNQIARVVDAAGGVGVFQGHVHVLGCHFVDGGLVARHEMPFFGRNAQVSGVTIQRSHRIIFWGEGVAQQLQPWVILEMVVYAQHLLGGFRANGGASDEKEVGHIGFSSESLVGHQVAVLVNEAEIGDGVSDGVAVLVNL